MLTRESTDVHFLQVFGLENNDSQFASGRHIAQWEANVTQLVFLLFGTIV